MTIYLTEEQRQTLDADEGRISVIDPRTNQTYILVKTEDYARIQSLLEKDFNAEDAFQAQIESAAASGWDDPALDVYR